MSLRIYLTGRVEVEADEASETLIPSSRFPGRQGRRAFAYLVCERGRRIPRAELADAIWDEGALPSAWDAALSALVSKLRGLLAGVGEGRAGTIATEAGSHELRLSPGAWVDIEAAAAAAEQAEAGLRAGRFYP